MTAIAPALVGQNEAPSHRLTMWATDERTTAGTIRVAIAHGQPSLRTRLRISLESAAGIAVVAETASGDETVAVARRARPDVVLMDVHLPGLDCVEATRHLRTAGTAVMLVASGETDHRVLAALRAGAGGVLLEQTNPSNLVRAVILLGRGRPLRPRRSRRARHIQEEAMLTPKVIEMRRGTAHGATALHATAAATRRRRV
jgi:DNA-binding NarL/FixJ family response regulator